MYKVVIDTVAGGYSFREKTIEACLREIWIRTSDIDEQVMRVTIEKE